MKRLDGGRKPITPPTLEEKISFLSTQLMVLRDRQRREMYGVVELSAIDREQLCHIILRKEAELLELQRYACRTLHCVANRAADHSSTAEHPSFT